MTLLQRARKTARAGTVRQPDSLPAADREAPVPRGPGAIVRAAAWFGLVAGALELTVFVVERQVLHRVVFDWLRINRHALWMVPAVDLGIALVVGLAIAATAPLLGRRACAVALGALGVLAALAPILTLHRIHPAACVCLAAGVGVRLAMSNDARLRRLQRFMRFSLPLLAAIVAIGGVLEYRRIAGAEARALAALPPAAPSAPNVLLIVLDTVRADHMSAYGYERPTTPRLDALARRGVQFDRAITPAPWTLPAHASLFTGRWHSQLTASADRALDASPPVLAELLRDHGYATAGFVGNTTNCNRIYGFDRGFVHYDDVRAAVRVTFLEALYCSEIGREALKLTGLANRLGLDHYSERKDAAGINRDVLAWLDGRRDRPFFAFVNYYDAHDPFVLPDGVTPRYGPARRTAEQEHVLRDWHHPGHEMLPEADARLIRDAYDDGIAYLDTQVGDLLDTMEARGLLDNTVVIVTADHGENLGEHDLYSHGRSLYQPEVHVPLLVFGPRHVPVGRRVEATASLRDVAATVAELTGLTRESPFPGRSLARYWRDEATGNEPVLSEVFIRTKPGGAAWLSPALREPVRAAFAGDRKYIWYGDGAEELFDLGADPEERDNLAGRAELGPYRTALGIKTRR